MSDLLNISEKLNIPFQVGVVLPLYNQKVEYINECLSALETQSFRNFKLIIVIDGANESTIEGLNDAVKQLTISYEIIRRNENKGIAYSLNEGFSYLKECEFLTWVSSDNVQYPDFLSTLVNEISCEQNNLVLVYSLFHLIDRNSERISTDNLRQEMVGFMQRPKEQIIQNCFVGASFLFRKDAFFQAGGYDTKYEKAEDYELWIRLLELGEIKFVNKFLMDYRIGGEYSYTTVVPKEELMFIALQASFDHHLLDKNIPKVTILLCTYNQEKYITEAIKSVLDQTFTDFQLIILDDASTDNTWYKINQFYDTRIMPIRLFENRGKAKILNIGLQYSLGEYILELDGDDWIEPSTLEIMVKEMDLQTKDVGLAYANRKIWFEKGEDIVEGPIYNGIEYKDKYEFLTTMKTHCPRLYRKAALDAIGGWPDEIIPGHRLMPDDYYIGLLLIEKFKFHWIDEVLYNQRRHEKNITSIEAEECRAQLKEIVEQTLKRWGDRYKPIFYLEGIWISKVKLVERLSSKDSWLYKMEDCQCEIANVSACEHYIENYSKYEVNFWSNIPTWMQEYNNANYVGRCLDIGTAYGTLALYCKKTFNCEVFCIDFINTLSSELINKYDIKFKNCNIELDQVPWDIDFDIIIFTEVLEHLNFYPIPTLKKIKSLLSKDGRLYISTPDSDSYGKLTDYYLDYKDMPYPNKEVPIIDSHIYLYNKDELMDIFNESGLETKSMEYSLNNNYRHLNIELANKK